MTPKLLVVFDLDHTLLEINSHYFFAEAFLARRAPLLLWLYRFVTKGVFGKILTRLVGCDSRRWLSLRCFGFFSQAELDAAAANLFRCCNEQMFNPGVVRLLETLRRSERHHVVLMSATPTFIARVFGERFGVEFFASQYRRGRLVFDLTGKKVERALSITDVVPHLFVSDNQEDINPAFPNYVLLRDGVMYLRCNDERVLECL